MELIHMIYTKTPRSQEEVLTTGIMGKHICLSL